MEGWKKGRRKGRRKALRHRRGKNARPRWKSAFCERWVRRTQKPPAPSPQCDPGPRELIRVKLCFPSSMLSFQTQEREGEDLSLREQSWRQTDPLGESSGSARPGSGARGSCACSQNANYHRPHKDATTASAGVGITSTPHWLRACHKRCHSAAQYTERRKIDCIVKGPLVYSKTPYRNEVWYSKQHLWDA